MPTARTDCPAHDDRLTTTTITKVATAWGARLKAARDASASAADDDARPSRDEVNEVKKGDIPGTGLSAETMARTHKQRAKTSQLMKVKRRTRDLDQLHADMLHQPEDVDLPGSARHYYCLHCARYSIDLQTLNVHFKTKTHKQRLKRLREAPFSQEAESCWHGLISAACPDLRTHVPSRSHAWSTFHPVDTMAESESGHVEGFEYAEGR
ncbi:unnamed protein product [Lampetra fluviatilis]